MKVLVLGAGGIGGYFGGRLAECGADVTFLVRQRRRDQLSRKGLSIESPLGNVRTKVKTVLAEEVQPGYGAVLFTCKAYDLDSAMDAIAPAIAGDAFIVPMLNGISHFDRLDARFGADRVVGGTCQINATLKSDGTVVHGDPLQRLLFGERDGKKSPRTEAFAAELAKTKIDYVHSDDIVQDLWDKVVFLAALATNTCLFRGNVREIIAAAGGKEAMEQALADNIAIATAEGHKPRPAAMERAKARLTDAEGLWSASMLRDLEAGNQVEADHVVGYMLARAKAHGIEASLLSHAYTHLKAYEARRAADRLPKPPVVHSE